MKFRQMTPEEIEHFEKQKMERLEEELKDYKPPTEEEIKEFHEQIEQDYYVSDMTPEEEAAFEKEAHESYQQYLIEEIEKKEQFLDYANHGIKFKKGKPSGAKSKKILYIEELVKKNPNLKAKELFKLADPEIIKQMALGTFQNHISKIKSKQK